MTTDISQDPRKKFVPRYLPWILAMVMLGVYWVTLDHWVSLYNMDAVAKLSGWTWQPEFSSPLLFLVTSPLRLLPTGQIPLALNLLSAVCGALTLGLLARSVTLLPQDRTEAQRIRETSDFSFLTTGTAWLPPVLAVLVCGLQFTFWENATTFTGETIDLLIFAFTVWTLLEYRLDEKEGRLLVAMVFYGADMTQNYGAIGFLPLLLAALVWIRGLSFFNSGFLLRMALCGLAGTSLYLLLPTMGVISGQVPSNLWWLALKLNLTQEWMMIKYFFTHADFRHDLGLISLTTLLPVVMMAFRWGAAFGDRSRLGTALTSLMIHLVYAVMLFMCIWVTFDPPFSPRHLGSGLPCLTFYYLAALSVGYYSGYFLLVSRRLILKNSRRRPSFFMRIMNPAAIVAIVVLAVLTTTGLVFKNGAKIRSINSNMLEKYARQMAACLPHTGGMVLSDSETSHGVSPRRLYLLEEALVQEGREKEYVPVDTFSLNSPAYHRYLHKKYPAKWPLLVDAKAVSALDPHGLLGMLQLLSKTNDIYYLHPSFGYYFETFYLEPHGLIYKLKNLPEDTLLPRLPDSQLKAENEAFWAQAKTEAFAPVIEEVTPINPFDGPRSLKEKLIARLHVKPELNFNALQVGSYYSRELDFWGVQLQRTKDLTNAAAYFESAQKLNPDNMIAGINLEFNQNLQAGRPASIDLTKTTTDQYGKYRSWGELVNANGPFDEPSFCYQDGVTFLQSEFLHQAIASFTRVRELVPDYLPALLSLGELYVFAHRPDQALAMLNGPLTHPDKYALNDDNSTELNVLAAAAYIQKTNVVRGIGLLEKEIARHPDNDMLLTTAAQVYMTQNLLTNAIHAIRLKLQLTPNDPAWLYNLAYVYLRQNNYEQAIPPLSQVISQQPNNNDALFNRALAFLNTGKFNAARSDYQQLQKNLPTAYQVAYGLGEIAWRQHETNDAVQAYTQYLANAPTNTPEAKIVSQRLAELQGKAP